MLKTTGFPGVAFQSGPKLCGWDLLHPGAGGGTDSALQNTSGCGSDLDICANNVMKDLKEKTGVALYVSFCQQTQTTFRLC